MSRNSPTGFLFSMALEIAAVAAIVALLPRVDLRPRSASSAEPLASPGEYRPAAEASRSSMAAGWMETSPGSNQPSARAVSYNEPVAGETNYSVPSVAPTARREPPPLLSADTPPSPQYVEERLDRASQQLVNSVGSFVTRAAGDVFGSAPPPNPAIPPPTAVTSRYAPPASAAGNVLSQPSFPTQPAASPRPTTPPTTFQPRPWMRY